MRSQQARRRIQGILLSGLLSACGGTGAPTGPGPAASPSVSPSPLGPSGFLHVLARDEMTTYRIDPATGHLSATARQSVGDVHQITGEPRGRFVYMADGPRTAQAPYGSPRPSIVAYAPAAGDGVLTPVSRATSYPIWQSSQPVRGEWVSLTAGPDRVYGIWLTVTYHDGYYDYVTHPVGADGQLGEAYDRPFDEFEGGHGLVDGRTRVFYQQGPEDVTADSVEPDGQLTRTGQSHLCGSSASTSPYPLAAARGFLLARGNLDRGSTLCTYEGASLSPRANLGFGADWVEPFVPSDENALVQLAVAPTVAPGSAVRELRLYSLLRDGSVQLLSTLELSTAVPPRVLFHPAGGFLFASVGTSLEVYTFDSGGHLTRVDTLPDAAGQMAVTYTSGR